MNEQGGECPECGADIPVREMDLPCAECNTPAANYILKRCVACEETVAVTTRVCPHCGWDYVLKHIRYDTLLRD